VSATTAAPPSAPTQPMPRMEARLLHWGISGICLLVLGKGLATTSHTLLSEWHILLPWVGAIALINLLPLAGWQSTALAADLPIGIAASLLLTPLQTGLVMFLGVFDSREFRGQISPTKAIFNRSQVSLANLLASLVVHMIVHSPATSPVIVPLAFLSLSLVTALNYILVGLAVSIEHGYPIGEVLRRLRLGTFTDFTLTFASWAVLGAMLAALYDQSHPWALLAFIAPALLARQTLMRSQMFLDTSRAHRSQKQVLTQLSHQIYEERSDERRLIAADLHDEVMQPLYKVALMAHVLKADLASGRLLEMDTDLPELIVAAEVASNTLRELIGDLRRSTLGRAGLSVALERLIQNARDRSTFQIDHRIDRIAIDAATELVIYQVAKEAMSNALSHSKGTRLSLELREDGEAIFLEVKDNGAGFDPVVEKEGHYGLQIMRERATSVGADLFIDSGSGLGSTVVFIIRRN
jgi:signal transduction histidine kinase